MKILAVDDEALALEMLTEAIEEAVPDANNDSILLRCRATFSSGEGFYAESDAAFLLRRHSLTNQLHIKFLDRSVIPMKILAVDDEALALEMLTEAIEEAVPDAS